VGYSKPVPLRGKHSTDEFESGEESLDVWLKRYARHAEAAGSARVYVTTDDGVCVVGYYALTIGEVGPELATERMKKGQPNESSVPVMLIARLAVDGDHRDQGLGRSLLQDALLRCASAIELVGARAIVAHAVSEEASAFYDKFGFEESPTDPLHRSLLVKDMKKFLRDNAGEDG
jgi:GNAT superfamily N-acetyltransferase